jgi:hypothetical protein
METLAYTIASIAGLAAWIPAARIYPAARRVKALRWALDFGIAIVLLIAISGVALCVNKLGVVGIPIALAVTGYVALFFSCTARMNATMMEVASDLLGARFARNPELEARFRQHWFLKRIMRSKD